MHGGIEKPFRIRIGINTGYCNVGNFGSADRMDYTIIGAEATLAARLQQVASTGEIVMSYETFALVSDMVVAHRLDPITMKGISREVMPYVVDTVIDEADAGHVVREQRAGISLFLDPSQMEAGDMERVRRALAAALAKVEERLAATGTAGTS